MRVLVLRLEHEPFFYRSLDHIAPFVALAAPTALAYTVSLMSTSLAGGVQKTSDSIQRIDPSRGYRLLRILLVFRIEARGRRWHCLAHICEFLSLYEWRSWLVHHI